MKENSSEFEFDKIIVVMRHGERADMADGITQYFHTYDPELTEKGKKQSFEAGKLIMDSLKKIINHDKFNITFISSPFARTLMTSFHVMNGMGLNQEIFIENGICELCTPNYFDVEPIKFLGLYTNDEKFIKEVKDYKIVNKSYSNFPNFPESYRTAYSRNESALK